MDTAQAILSSPDYFLCTAYNCRMSRSACSMRKRVARQQDEDGKDVTFSKCLDCPVKEGPVEKVCMVEGCGKKITARGRCSTHYAQYRSEIQRQGRVPAVGERPKPKTEPAEQKPPKNIPKIIPRPDLKVVDVHFRGSDVDLWKTLKDRAEKNRRTMRTEALFIIQTVLLGKGEWL